MKNYPMQMWIFACKWKLSHANENYPMQRKIVACKWKLSNANEKYPMQMEIIQCKWKIIACKWKIIQCKWKIIACKWKIIQCKWKRSNIATFHMPYNIHVDIFVSLSGSVIFLISSIESNMNNISKAIGRLLNWYQFANRLLALSVLDQD